MPQLPDSLTAAVDGAVGGAVESAVRAKHARRLHRLGWSRALTPSGTGTWAQGAPPPRVGCELEVLIDGQQAMAAIAAELEQAQTFVHITGWHLAAHFELVRGDASDRSGPPAGGARRTARRPCAGVGRRPAAAVSSIPGRGARGVQQLVRQTKIRCELDPREHPMHCHHEKTVVVDGRVAFVGGIDMTDLGGDRNDAAGHPARRRLGWHDVGTRLHGPAVADVGAHFALRWEELTGETVPQPPAPRAVRRSHRPGRTHGRRGHVRTVATRRLQHPGELHARAGRGAELIYLENQFLWAPEIVELLAAKLRNPPQDNFRIVIVLPAKANNGQDDTKGQLGGWSPPTTATDVCWRRPCAHSPAPVTIRSMYTRRLRSSTTAG